MKVFDDGFVPRVKHILLKIKHPKAGFFERYCMLAGYTKPQLDDLYDEEIKRYGEEAQSREEFFEMESTYFEY